MAELRKDNNQACVRALVASTGTLVVSIQGDRAQYGAQSQAQVQVTFHKAGRPFQGTARPTVEDPSGLEVAVLDSRPLALEYAAGTQYLLPWSVGTTYAGGYVFHVRATDLSGALAAQATVPLQVLPRLAAAPSRVPDQPSILPGRPATL